MEDTQTSTLAQVAAPASGARLVSGLPDRLARTTPDGLARRLRGLSDRAIAWAFITPTIVLLLAINVFPLIWTTQLSFTNYRANRPNAVVRDMGLENYRAILTDPDVWGAMQATAHWTMLLQTVIGFALAWLIDRKFRGHGFWTTVILVPMMLSPAVVGNFWTFLWDIFEHQPASYREHVLPPSVKARIAIEQASVLGWDRYAGAGGRVIGMKTFGASAPLKELQRKFGFEPERVVATAMEQLGRA